MSVDVPSESRLASRWPWLAFAAALVWVVLIRIPLIINSPSHLDSDLAVDGLTLLHATQGRLAWHYPGTPYMGAGTVLLSLPQALIWGPNPVTLVSGGTVAYGALLLATFLLGWRAFGPVAAVLGLIPLTFASTGAVWLSGRITGGHLAAAIFHAGLFFGFASLLKTSLATKRAAFALGLWAGFGLYLDSMLALSLLGVSAASGSAWLGSREKRRGIALGLAFLGGLTIGIAPREIGARLDPYSAYESQFQLVTDRDLLIEHAKLLSLDCLPRLFAGHRLPGLETEPDPRSLSGPGTLRSRSQVEPLGLAVCVLALGFTLAAFGALCVQIVRGERVLAFGLLVSTVATLAAFITNRNIYNSDNYRYLVTLLVPASVGFGLLMRRFWNGRWKGKGAAFGLSALLAILMTADLGRWYHQFGWIDDNGRPVALKVNDPTLAWLDGHPEIERISGGYWDVYRLIFLGGGRLKGSPYPIYPDRYPAWKKQPGEREVLIARPSPEARTFVDRATASGGRVLQKSRGITILSMP